MDLYPQTRAVTPRQGKSPLAGTYWLIVLLYSFHLIDHAEHGTVNGHILSKSADLQLLHAGHELISDNISNIFDFFQSQTADT